MRSSSAYKVGGISTACDEHDARGQGAVPGLAQSPGLHCSVGELAAMAHYNKHLLDRRKTYTTIYVRNSYVNASD